MAQTATMTKLRGRHYAAKARAAQIHTTPSHSTRSSTVSSVSRATASNESLARRLNSTRFHNTRYQSPSRRNDAAETKAQSAAIPSGRDPRRSRATGAAASAAHRTVAVAAAAPAVDREMELVQGISDRLETGLNEPALRAILDLLKRGEHPDAIVAVVTSLAQQQSR